MRSISIPCRKAVNAATIRMPFAVRPGFGRARICSRKRRRPLGGSPVVRCDRRQSDEFRVMRSSHGRNVMRACSSAPGSRRTFFKWNAWTATTTTKSAGRIRLSPNVSGIRTNTNVRQAGPRTQSNITPGTRWPLYRCPIPGTTLKATAFQSSRREGGRRGLRTQSHRLQLAAVSGRSVWQRGQRMSC